MIFGPLALLNAGLLAGFEDAVGVVSERTELVVHVGVEHLDPDVSFGHALDCFLVEALAQALALTVE